MAVQQERLAERIIKDPEILLGKPTVRGTRIPVDLVLEHLAYKPDLADLLAAYPRLTVDDVRACLAYANHAVRRGSRKDAAAANVRPAPPQQGA
jgi:uncharacterized protein (DUF433 family)